MNWPSIEVKVGKQFKYHNGETSYNEQNLCFPRKQRKCGNSELYTYCYKDLQKQMEPNKYKSTKNQENS